MRIDETGTRRGTGTEGGMTTATVSAIGGVDPTRGLALAVLAVPPAKGL
jgi:hypothetical protein